jgi:hypothetical protein
MAQCEKYDTPPDIKLNEVMVRFVPNIVIRALRVTLLSDSGYALIGYEYCARIM